MADYYPLISRAIAGLDPNAPGEARRALYERARSALIAQLRSVQPPLTESEITRERLSLEEAVRKVESEAAQRARSGGTNRSAGPAGPPARSRGRDAAAPTERERGAEREIEWPTDRAERGARQGRPERQDRPEPPADREQAEQPEAEKAERPVPERPRLFPLRETTPRPPRNLREQAGRAAAPPPPSSASRADDNEPAEPPQGAKRPGIPGFSDVTADADDLGRAARSANRAARRTFANVPSPTPEFERLEPKLEDRGEGQTYDFDAPDQAIEPAAKPSRFSLRGRGKEPQEPQEPKPATAAAPRRARAPFPLKSAIAIGLIMVLVGAAILWGPRAYSSLRAMLRTTPPVVETTPKDSGPRPKIADRVGQGGEQIATIAQRVVLYDEDPAEPAGKQYVGSVVWRTEMVKGSGGASDVAVRADLEIPDRKFRMTMSFRRNTDTSLPASHTAELTFTLPPDFSSGGVSNVPGILMKSNEQARGTPLAGLAVKVTDGFFLVGLSNVEADRVRNIQLLKERSWFDIPLVYANQRRAIIAIEKGPPGERAFNDAFATWGE
jgi:hypothetical protein